MDPRIFAIELVPQTLLMPAVKESFADALSGNTRTNRNSWQVSWTGVNVSIPISTQIHSGISKNYIPVSSDSTGTRVSIGTSGTSTAPPAEYIWCLWVGNKRQSNNPNLRYSYKLDTSIDGNFTNNLVAPRIFTEVVSENSPNVPAGTLCARSDAPHGRYHQSRDTIVCGFAVFYCRRTR